MSTFPNSPRLLKGAIIGLDPVNPLASVIVFQYNPDTRTRTCKSRGSGRGLTAARCSTADVLEGQSNSAHSSSAVLGLGPEAGGNRRETHEIL